MPPPEDASREGGNMPETRELARRAWQRIMQTGALHDGDARTAIDIIEEAIKEGRKP